MKRTTNDLPHKVLWQDRKDGSILLRPADPLGDVAERTGDWLHRWAAEDAPALVQDLMAVTQQALLGGVWGRLLARAVEHPEPARIRRLAALALHDAEIFARTRLARMG